MEIPTTSKDYVKTATTEYWKVEGEDILYGNLLPGSIIDVPEVEENNKVRLDLLDVNRPIAYILDITQIDRITKEGRKLSSESTDGISCIALIVGSGLSKIIGNYALMLNKPKIPLKLFTSLTDARLWARDYMPN